MHDPSSNPQYEERTWWQRNRKKVFAVGGVVILTGAGVLLFVERKDIARFLMRHLGKKGIRIAQQTASISEPVAEAVISEAPQKATMVLNGGQPFAVEAHTRNLPTGWKASAEQRELAESLGIRLDENQTFVKNYFKNVA